MRERGRLALLNRYQRAIERMDAKLLRFYEQAARAGLWDDTLLVVASDHGEAFGEHELYFHDASVYETHLHVPLWVQHPAFAAREIDDVVSLRHVGELLCKAAARPATIAGTILDSSFRERHPIALAEHFHTPHVPKMQARYRRNLAAAISAERKVIVRGDETLHFDLRRDPQERDGERAPIEVFCVRREPATAFVQTSEHLRAFQDQFGRVA